MILIKSVGDRIKEIMKQRNMKQIDLVEQSGISKGALSSYLSGKYEPKSDNIIKIANALNVNPGVLLGYADNDTYVGSVKYFGVTLKYFREKYHYTQEELNKRLNLPNNLIYQFEKGELSPTDDMLERLSSFFNIHYTYLLDDYYGTVYDRIMRVIQNAKLSQDEFWARLYVTSDLYTNWDKNISKSYLQYVERISIEYDVPLDFIFGDMDISSYHCFQDSMSNMDANELKLLEFYRALNAIGKDEALKRLEELSSLDKYTT